MAFIRSKIINTCIYILTFNGAFCVVFKVTAKDKKKTNSLKTAKERPPLQPERAILNIVYSWLFSEDEICPGASNSITQNGMFSDGSPISICQRVK